MYAEITKQFRFEAAHQLPGHDGQCARLHGHSYRIEVTIGGDIETDATSPKRGMVLDFADVSDWWKAQIEHHFDHSGRVIMLTAENLADEILGMFQHATFGDKVKEVTVWETDTARATVRA